ncbi:MAG: HTTM domain-containing protein, partial [Bacteroidota bacterium]
DVLRRPSIRATRVPAWTIDLFKVQLGFVYVFAGLAKLNPNWLFEAMPLKLWLPAQSHTPIVGPLLQLPITAYLFSWAGALYDLFIVFFLLWRRTRPLAYAAVVAFHVMTAILFPIGMFPYIMIGATLIYFSPAFHEKLLHTLSRLWPFKKGQTSDTPARDIVWTPSRRAGGALAVLMAAHFALQLFLPVRYMLYPGELFWTEQGYRFSWRVMLMEKAGYTVFNVTDPETGQTWQTANWEYLTPQQEKMMATQPDLILQYAHFLESEYAKEGRANVEIRAESYVTLNGRRSRPFIDPTVDLTEIAPGFRPKTWILPFEDGQLNATLTRSR